MTNRIKSYGVKLTVFKVLLFFSHIYKYFELFNDFCCIKPNLVANCDNNYVHVNKHVAGLPMVCTTA